MNFIKKNKLFIIFLMFGFLNSFSSKVFANNAYYFYQLGENKLNDGDNYGAIIDFNKAIFKKGDFANAYIARCGAKVNIGKNIEAIEDCLKASSLKSNNPRIFSNICGAMLNLGTYEIAEKFCNQAIDLNDNDGLAYINRGSIKYNSGNIRGACKDWGKASNLGYTYASNLENDYCY